MKQVLPLKVNFIQAFVIVNIQQFRHFVYFIFLLLMWFASHALQFVSHNISICKEDNDVKQTGPMRIRILYRGVFKYDTGQDGTLG